MANSQQAKAQAPQYQIGQLAKISGLSRDTIRYYESTGLIPQAPRSSSGYRLYSQQTLQQLGFIHNAKTLGFSLKDIAELLSINLDKDLYSCENVKDLSRHKLQQVEQKIAELEKIRSALQQLHNICCGGQEPASSCSILQKLNQQQYAASAENQE